MGVNCRVSTERNKIKQGKTSNSLLGSINKSRGSGSLWKLIPFNSVLALFHLKQNRIDHPWLSSLPCSNPCLPGKDFSTHAIYNCISPDPLHACYIFLHCIYLLLKSCKMSLFILLSLSPLEKKLQKGRDVSLFCSLL